MEILRKITNWIGGHRILSLALVAALIFAITFLRGRLAEAEGTLSAPLQKGRIVESVYGIGTVMANRSYQIKSGVTSTIYQLFVEEGDDVEKGAKLLNLDGTVFTAPFSGTVTNLPFKIRENVFPQTPILTLVDLDDRYVVISLEQQGALRVKRDQKAKLSFDSLRDQSSDGVVKSIYSSENNFLARINLSNLPGIILPGMTADVAIIIRESGNALLAPVSALEDGKFFWVKRGRGLPAKVEVKTGIIDKTMVEVLSGDLREGDQVLIRKQASQ